MKTRFLSLTCGFAVATLACTTVAQADTLLMQRVKQENGMNAPQRGMTMTQVESRYGAPTNKLGPAGGDAPRHPVINRWVYPNYTVYFESNRVIDSVANRASPTEVGPKHNS